MPFAPENPLEEILLRAASDPSQRPRFYSMLMRSPLYALGTVENHTACDHVLPSLDRHAFELATVDMNGRRYHPVFSARSRIEAMSREPHPFFAVAARSLFENTRGAAFLLNCGSDVGKELLPAEIGAMLKQRPRARGDIAFSEPEPYPGKLTGALGILFLNRSQVTSAHLLQAALRDGEPPHLLIGLVARGDARRIISEIGQVADTLSVDRMVDVMVINPDKPHSELAARLVATPPFYARPVTPYS